MKGKASLIDLTKGPHLGERPELMFSDTDSALLFVTSRL